jgi:hypothetical protein
MVETTRIIASEPRTHVTYLGTEVSSHVASQFLNDVNNGSQSNTNGEYETF